jgi:hypothetical protein
MSDKSKPLTTEMVKVSEIIPNQSNPRVIRDGKFKKLVNSIREFPEMLNLRPIVVDNEMVVLGGNMRLKAAIEAGFEEVPVIKASSLTEEQKQEFIIKDNVAFGDWDWEVLNNDWDIKDIENWGLELNLGDSDMFDVEDDKPERTGERPMATDDDYSVFECVMRHENKLRLILGINEAKEKHGLEKTEDALIAIVNKYLNHD